MNLTKISGAKLNNKTITIRRLRCCCSICWGPLRYKLTNDKGRRRGRSVKRNTTDSRKHDSDSIVHLAIFPWFVLHSSITTNGSTNYGNAGPCPFVGSIIFFSSDGMLLFYVFVASIPFSRFSLCSQFRCNYRSSRPVPPEPHQPHQQ